MSNKHDVPAPFIEEGENVYTFIGHLITDESPMKVAASSSYRVQNEIDETSLKLIEFVKFPRAESAIKKFLQEQNLDGNLLESLVGEGIILQMNTKNVHTALDGFNGVKIVSLAVSGEMDPETALIEIKRTKDSPVEAFITPELAQVLWGAEKNLNVYRAIRKISKNTGVESKTVARRVLTNVPALLKLGLVHLEWEDDLGVSFFGKIAKLFIPRG